MSMTLKINELIKNLIYSHFHVCMCSLFSLKLSYLFDFISLDVKFRVAAVKFCHISLLHFLIKQVIFSFPFRRFGLADNLENRVTHNKFPCTRHGVDIIFISIKIGESMRLT